MQSLLRPIVIVPAALVFTTMAAFAETGKADGPSEFLLVAQIVLLIAVGRGLGEIMMRIGQPSVIGELLAGIILGPSLFGWIWPEAQHAIFPKSPEQKAMIDGIAQFGILLLLLLTGMETDLKLVRKVGRAAIAISVAGIIVPFACGFALGEFLPDALLPDPQQRLVASLFMGTALSISSVKIVAVVVREMNFMRRNVGQIIVSTAVIDDTIGLIIIAIIFSLASHGTLDIASVAKAVLGTLAFLAVSFTIGRRLVFQLIRWANDNLVSAAPVITVILLLMSVMAMITHLIGVHTVLGAFVAGILVGESPILTRQIDERLRGLISSFFMPVFFGLAGLSADLSVLRDPNLLMLTGLLVVIASVGKFGGAFVGGTLGGLNARESLALASGMNARGSTEVIIATIGLSIGVLSQNLFTMIVTMAIVTTMAMPPMLRAALARLPMSKEEKERLEREEFEKRGFVANLERPLLAVDESVNASFAAHIAGLIAGKRNLPLTVLHIGQHAKEQEKGRDRGQGPLRPQDRRHRRGVRRTARDRRCQGQAPEAADARRAQHPRSGFGQQCLQARCRDRGGAGTGGIRFAPGDLCRNDAGQGRTARGFRRPEPGDGNPQGRERSRRPLRRRHHHHAAGEPGAGGGDPARDRHNRRRSRRDGRRPHPGRSPLPRRRCRRRAKAVEGLGAAGVER